MTDALERKPVRALRARRLASFVVMLVVVAATLSIYAYHHFYGQYAISTDDAYVGGNQVQLMPQVSGTVIRIAVDETQSVKAGDSLVELDALDAEVALRQAESALANTVRLTQQQFENVAQLRAVVRQRQLDVVRADADMRRRAPLANDQTVATEDLAHAQNAAESARAGLTGALRQADAAAALVVGTSIAHHPAVEQARAVYVAAAVARARVSLVAPVSGLVAKRSVQLGQRVAPGSALLAIVPLDGLWVDANFKEGQLAYVRVGQPVTLWTDLYGTDIQYHGRVVGLGAGTGSAFAALPAQNATGNWIKVVQRLPVRIALEPKELADHPLRIGLSVTATVDTHDRSGPRTTLPTATPVYVTDAESLSLQTAEQHADAVIAAQLRGRDPQ